MKKLIAAAALISASSFAMADNGPAGCGLGTAVVFPDANEWHEHVLAATTNGTSGNQTFGMTSGTLGCESANGPLKAAEAFMNDNMDQLAADSARGQGETLDALAQVMGVEAADTAAFRATVQSNFDSMFTTEATAGDAFRSLTEAMSQDKALQKYVG
ncbi:MULTISPECIES: DUF3015 family protein [Thalassolituus]|jgi:hypothetical protein|uniref:DUF3015 domain-containing protein n=1 Tax=Thalassolituus maritimus TaxID=484498 RepID=A0A1N7PR58_9GAMM|nr:MULTISPECIES: DUF3015 family protein [Thalassolituus]MAX87857.1 DUF3015 domain-containing protein [Oceanospirillaceae bacterium]MEC9256629.1 DUF3015 family protein [Pseudomonadota bacterium]HCG79627.1 DUF3015 domain-containing protein [Oceanospirillales bacterium]MEC9410681.1 DUF3015 family protein [Pseudomonadota bacterium]MEE3161576.1 DUF3015 family protein [Pseudomonadota bacterium]|tara:strand:- start:299 stop:772 length:474 start_codon:yes stop_codon:yes gene_type:complete